jgi:riboflavin synthase alpha subunit
VGASIACSGCCLTAIEMNKSKVGRHIHGRSFR